MERERKVDIGVMEKGESLKKPLMQTPAICKDDVQNQNESLKKTSPDPGDIAYNENNDGSLY